MDLLGVREMVVSSGPSVNTLDFISHATDFIFLSMKIYHLPTNYTRWYILILVEVYEKYVPMTFIPSDDVF